MQNIIRVETTRFLDLLPVRVSSQCVREKNHIHMHRHMQICYVRSGTLRHIINGYEYIQEPGSCSVILPYTKHMVDSTQSEDTPVIIFISFFDDFLSKLGYRIFPYGGELASFEDHTIPPFCEFSNENFETAQDCIQKMIDEFSLKNNMDIKKIAEKIAQILRLMCIENSNKIYIKASARVDGIKRATEYIDENYIKKISIDTLCPVAGMSRSTLTINFKAITGLTVSNYILSRRLSEALNLLTHTNMLLDDIAAQTGLYNRTNLTRVLRKHMGISPSEFREELKAQNSLKHKIHFPGYEWLMKEENTAEQVSQ